MSGTKEGRRTERESAAQAHPESRERSKGWQDKLQAIIDAHADRKVHSRRATAHKTRHERALVLFRAFKELRALGYKIEDPCNLKPKHLQVLFRAWEQRGLAPATIQNQISFFRIFAGWIGKPDLVGDSATYMADPASVQRSYAATRDKSWRANGVDIQAVHARIEALSAHVAMQFRLVEAFGLRRQEAVMFRPHLADQGAYLHVTEGTKGGRGRAVKIVTDHQRQVLAEAKAFVDRFGGGAQGHVGRRGKSLEQNLTHYSYVLGRAGATKRELGVTGHGQRAAFVCDTLERHGVTAAVRGGELGARPAEQELRAYQITSEEVGHSRVRVMTAYCGAPVPAEPKKRQRGRGRSGSELPKRRPDSGHAEAGAGGSTSTDVTDGI